MFEKHHGAQVAKGAAALSQLLARGGGGGPSEGLLPLDQIFDVMQDAEHPKPGDIPITGCHAVDASHCVIAFWQAALSIRCM